MTFEQEQQFVSKIKKYVTDNLSLSQISDDDLQQRIEEIVEQYIGEQYVQLINEFLLLNRFTVL
mgnify:CR=1 FL=1